MDHPCRLHSRRGCVGFVVSGLGTGIDQANCIVTEARRDLCWLRASSGLLFWGLLLPFNFLKYFHKSLKIEISFFFQNKRFEMSRKRVFLWSLLRWLLLFELWRLQSTQIKLKLVYFLFKIGWVSPKPITITHFEIVVSLLKAVARAMTPLDRHLPIDSLSRLPLLVIRHFELWKINEVAPFREFILVLLG